MNKRPIELHSFVQILWKKKSLILISTLGLWIVFLVGLGSYYYRQRSQVQVDLNKVQKELQQNYQSFQQALEKMNKSLNVAFLYGHLKDHYRPNLHTQLKGKVVALSHIIDESFTEDWERILVLNKKLVDRKKLFFVEKTDYQQQVQSRGKQFLMGVMAKTYKQRGQYPQTNLNFPPLEEKYHFVTEVFMMEFLSSPQFPQHQFPAQQLEQRKEELVQYYSLFFTFAQKFSPYFYPYKIFNSHWIYMYGSALLIPTAQFMAQLKEGFPAPLPSAAGASGALAQKRQQLQNLQSQIDQLQARQQVYSWSSLAVKGPLVLLLVSLMTSLTFVLIELRRYAKNPSGATQHLS